MAPETNRSEFNPANPIGSAMELTNMMMGELSQLQESIETTLESQVEEVMSSSNPWSVIDQMDGDQQEAFFKYLTGLSTESAEYDNNVARTLDVLIKLRESNQNKFRALFTNPDGSFDFHKNSILEAQLSLAMIMPDSVQYLIVEGQLVVRGHDASGRPAYLQTGAFPGAYKISVAGSEAGVKSALFNEDHEGENVPVNGETAFRAATTAEVSDYSGEIREMRQGVRSAQRENGVDNISVSESMTLQRNRAVRERIAATTSRSIAADATEYISDAISGESNVEDDEEFWTPEVVESLRTSEDPEVQAVFQEIEHRWENNARLNSQLSGSFDNDPARQTLAYESFQRVNIPGVTYDHLEGDTIIATMGTNGAQVKIYPERNEMIPAEFEYDPNLALSINEANLTAVQVLSTSADLLVAGRQQFYMRELRRAGGIDRFADLFGQLFPFRTTPLDETTAQSLGRGIERHGVEGFIRIVEARAAENAGGQLPEGINLMNTNGRILTQNAPYFRRAINDVLAQLQVGQPSLAF